MYINSLEQGIQYFRNDENILSIDAIYGKKLVLIDDIDSINEQSQQVFVITLISILKIFIYFYLHQFTKVIESLADYILYIPKYSINYIEKA